jgi:hypothetical protein
VPPAPTISEPPQEMTTESATDNGVDRRAAGRRACEPAKMLSPVATPLAAATITRNPTSHGVVLQTRQVPSDAHHNRSQQHMLADIDRLPVGELGFHHLSQDGEALQYYSLH